MRSSKRVFAEDRAAATRCAVALVVAVVAACELPRRAAPGSGDDAPRFELVSDEPALRDGPPATRADELLFRDDLVAFDLERWQTPRMARGESRDPAPGVQIFAEGEGAQGVALLMPGEGGMHAGVTLARDDDALVAIARVRSFSAGASAQLRLTDLSDDGREISVAQRPIAPGPGFAEVFVVLDRRHGRRRVRVELVPGEGALAVDRIELAFVRPLGRALLDAPASHRSAPPRARLRTGLAEMDAEMDGFLVPAGGVLRWRTRIPAGAPHLDVETAITGSDRGGRARWSAVVDGVPLAERDEELAPGRWITPFTAWEVAIPGGAREAVVELRFRGDGDVVGFAGAPRVAGGTRRAGAPPNVVVVSLDTLRADRVGPRPGQPSLTPRLDDLAARGALFTRAASTSSWTLPAHGSLMTGQHPLVHGALDVDRPLDPVTSPLLALRFRERGYATAAFTAGGFVDPAFGFAPGFDAYSVRDPCGEPHDAADPAAPSDEAIDATPRRALEWLRRHADVPFFLFLHTYKVHDFEDAAHEGANAERCALLDRATAGDAAAVAELARRYDACVAESDRALLGALLDRLRALGLEDDTIVAVVSDHGEEFLEHGGFRHGLTLHDEVGSVVLVLAGPGVPRGARIDAPASLTDVAPTLARLVGLPDDPRSQGRDLLAGEHDPDRPLLLHLDHVCDGGVRARGEALWLGEWRVQRRWSKTGVPELSFERRDAQRGGVPEVPLTEAQRAALERRLDEELQQELRRAARDAASGRRDLPESLRARLRALGYAGD